ncbi:acid protease [Poronia punctata]|nr:acid protease [Poronia punctata]
MHSIKSILFLVYGLLALAAASPAPGMLLHKRGAFKVDRVRNPHAIPKNGPRALLKTLRKYRMPVSTSLVHAAERQEEVIAKREPRRQKGMGGFDFGIQSFGGGGGGGNHRGKGNGRGRGKGRGKGSNNGHGISTAPPANNNGTGIVPNQPEANDVEYLSPVSIGGQQVNLDFDTGSSDLWVFNTRLQRANTQGHQLYDPDSSPTFQPMRNAHFQIQYGDGSGALGVVGTDVVNIGGAQVDAQAVELATDVSESFVRDTATDGLLGLAFSSINTVQPRPQKTFFENVMPALAEPLFTADLRPGAAGAYEFGRIDASKFKGEMTFVKIDSTRGFWEFPSETFSIGNNNNNSASQTSVPGNKAIADTGTTLLLADPAVVTAYYSQVPGAQDATQQQGGFTIPCDANLPDLQLAVGDSAMATIKGSDLVFAPVDGQTCFGALQAGQSGGLQVYGDIFFKSNFVVFHGGDETLGFAPHA